MGVDVRPGGGGAPSRAGGATGEGRVDPEFWRARRVLLTGHTGFKGAWMALWLQTLGAHVTGFAAGAPAPRSLYELAGVGDGMRAVDGDVRDHEAVARTLDAANPEVVIHMAAQPLVRRSYSEPRETYEVNVMGTVNVLDAARRSGAARVVLNVTSDKCYADVPAGGAHREGDPMGGGDPYSSSKGCAELVTDAYRRSFFADGATRVASARAGNVIGGGDWGEDRLLPDLMRAALGGEAARVRNPAAIRPWQHVINPLGGYLLLAQAAWRSADHARAWNFGPDEHEAVSVGAIAERVAALWPSGLRWEQDPPPHPPEVARLVLDSSLARSALGWRPALDLDAGLRATVEWYAALDAGADMRALTLRQIETLAAPMMRADTRA